jgi:tryptophan synthase alpha chain
MTTTQHSALSTQHSALDETFARARAEDRLALMLYLTVGYPTPADTVPLAELLARHGADLLELGMPFSDPFGDGLTIQHTSHQALAQGITVERCLETAEEIHRRVGIPICLMGYLNPVLKYGVERFCRRAAAAGVTGLVLPDLPVEEAAEMRQACHAHGLHLVAFLAPTSTEDRIAAVAAHGSGFIYCMSVAGVTGARSALSSDLGSFLGRVRARTTVPLLVGFGISRPEHLRQLHGIADGAVVASALIDLLDRLPSEEREAGIGAYVASLRAACAGE